MRDKMVFLKSVALFCLVVNTQYVELTSKFYGHPAKIKKFLNTRASFELSTLALPNVHPAGSANTFFSSSNARVSGPHSTHVEPLTEIYGPPLKIKNGFQAPLSYTPHSGPPASVYGPPVETTEIFHEPPVEIKEPVSVPPPPELPPLNIPKFPPPVIVEKPVEVVAAHTPIETAPYPPYSGPPANIYGPPVETTEVFHEPPVEIKEPVSVPPPPELPPLNIPKFPPPVIVEKPVEVVAAYTPIETAPYLPYSGPPANIYGPPVETTEVFHEAPVEIKEAVSVPPPPELPPLNIPKFPPPVIVEKPVEVVAAHTPIETAPYPPYSGPPANIYGPPVETTEVFHEAPVEIKEAVSVPPPPELPPLNIPKFPPPVIVEKPVEVVAAHTPIETAPYPPYSGSPANIYGPPMETTEVFHEPSVEIKEAVSVPPPPELPPLNIPKFPPPVIVEKPVEVVAAHTPIETAPYPPYSGPPANIYGPPVETTEVFHEAPVEIKEAVSVPPPPELPPLNIPKFPPPVIVEKPVEVVAAHTPIETAPYPPYSGSPANIYGPPVETTEVFHEPPVEIKEAVSVPPPPELPPLNIPKFPPPVIVEKPVEVVAAHTPIETAPYPPYSGPPANIYGPPMETTEVFHEPSVEIKEPVSVPLIETAPYPPYSGPPANIYGPPVETTEVFHEPHVEIKEPVSVPPPPELPALNIPKFPPPVIVEKPVEVVAAHTPIETAPYPPYSGPPANIYGPPVETTEVFHEPSVEIKEPVSVPLIETAPYPPYSGPPGNIYGPPVETTEVFHEPPVEIKEAVSVPPPPELPPLNIPKFPPPVIVEKPVEVVAAHTPIETAPYPPYSGPPANIYGPPVETTEVFHEPPVEIKESVSVPPPPELPPLNIPEIPTPVIVEKPVKVVTVHAPIKTAPYPPYSGPPANAYGPPVEITKFFHETPVEIKGPVSAPPVPELPPLKFYEIPTPGIVKKTVEAVAVQKPIETAPYPPYSGLPANVYGPPVEVKKHFSHSTNHKQLSLLLPENSAHLHTSSGNEHFPSTNTIQLSSPHISVPVAGKLIFNPDCAVFHIINRK